MNLIAIKMKKWLFMGCFVLNKLWEIIKNFFDGIFKALEFIGLMCIQYEFCF